MSTMTLEHVRDELRAVAFNPGKDCWKRVLNAADAIDAHLTSREANRDEKPVAWGYSYEKSHGGSYEYKTFRHPIKEMGLDPDRIDWWVIGYAHPAPQQATQPAEQPRGEAVAWQYRNVFRNEKSHKWHFIDKAQFDNWLSNNDPSIELRELVVAQPKPEHAVGDGVVELLQRGFITSQSYGPDKDYKLVIKFPSLAELQAAHRAVTAPRPAVATAGDGVTEEMVERAIEAHDAECIRGSTDDTWKAGELIRSSMRAALAAALASRPVEAAQGGVEEVGRG